MVTHPTGVDGLVALLSLGAGVVAWWCVAKWLGTKGKGVLMRHGLGLVAWFMGTTVLFGTAQAIGLVKPAPKSATEPTEPGNEAVTPPNQEPRVAAPALKLAPRPKPTLGVTASYLAGEFCPSNSACYTFTDADEIEARRKGKRVHVVGTLKRDPSTSLFGSTPGAELEGREYCPVKLEFAEGSDKVLSLKKGQQLSAKCVYQQGSDKGVTLRDCTLAPPPSSTEPPAFSWASVKMPEPPPELAGMSTPDVDDLYRAVLVTIWNGGVTMGRDHEGVYKRLAEKLNVHVDKLRAAHDFVGKKQKALAYGFRQLLDRDKQIAPEHYGPVGATAYGGSYTFDAELHLAFCPPDDDKKAKELAEEVVQRLRKLLPEQATALRVPRVHYECEKLGTDGVLDFGYLWRLSDADPKEMTECSGTYAVQKPEEAGHWCQSSWNDKKKLEH